MAIASQPVAEGQSSSATDYNNLRADLLDEHDHQRNAGRGGPVRHSSLVDGAMTGTYTNHAAINNHVQGTGELAEPDAAGGDRGVHGLPAIAYVAGLIDSAQKYMQIGTGVTDDYVQIETTGWYDQTVDVVFTTAFKAGTTPVVFISPTDSGSARKSAYNITNTGFTARIGFPFEPKGTTKVATSFTWFAIGEPA